MTTNLNTIFRHKPAIDKTIDLIFIDIQKKFITKNRFISEAIEQLQQFSKLGKSIRGNVIITTYLMFGGKNSLKIRKIAAGVEIVHTALLIHDDIMDEDKIRRGQPAVHAYYSDLAKKMGINKSELFGHSLAICIGDIGILLGLATIEEALTNHFPHLKLAQQIIQEYVLVAKAQLQDVYFGLSNYEPSLDEIAEVYLYKTARYTFSLPLMLGAALAGTKSLTINQLDRLGECLGMIFQLRDDEIGVFSDSAVSGKEVASDIRENKKTFLRYFLLQKLNPTDKQRLQRFLGKSVSKNDISWLRKKINSYYINDQLAELKQEETEKARKIIYQLPIDNGHQKLLLSLTDYLLRRTH